MDHIENFTQDWFAPNVENWTRWLAEYRGKPGVRCLEIGSFEGRSATWLLKNILTHETSTLDCYDLCQSPWIERFEANTRPWRHRIRMRCGQSFWTLRELEGEYDIIYIDADHSPFGIMCDSVLTWPALKVGGILIFDDYLWLPADLAPGGGTGPEWSYDTARQAIARHPMDAPKTGIDAFLAAMSGHYELIGHEYQVAIRKTKAVPQKPQPEPTRSRWPAWLTKALRGRRG
jgi:predicted O-methyltransferase YrrM